MLILLCGLGSIVAIFTLFFLTSSFVGVTNILYRDMREFFTMGLSVLMFSVAALWDYKIAPLIIKRDNNKHLKKAHDQRVFAHLHH